MQEASTMGSVNASPRDALSSQSLVALLALVSSRRMKTKALREKVKLGPQAFGDLLKRLQREYLVEVALTLEGDRAEEKVELTEEGESFLISVLEKTCELPEPH